jgi:hypothetical protein
MLEWMDRRDSRMSGNSCGWAWNKDPDMECAPASGQNQTAALTVCWAC